jgi:hypothetical protein
MVFVLTFIIALFATPSFLPPHAMQETKTATPIGDVELATVLRDAHLEVFGEPASKARLAVAWGQIAFENGRGKETFNYNLGNIGPYKGRPYYKQGLSRFRAFTGFHEAAKVYWELLRDRCSGAMHSFDAMDALYTATKLRRCGYHGADIDLYARGLGSLMWVGYKLHP